MEFKIEDTALGGLVVLVPGIMGDERGFFSEVFRVDKFKELGLPYKFVQDNHSRSACSVLRGLHFQWEPPMGKLMRVTRGEAYLAAVDIRKNSPTLGQWYGTIVNTQNRRIVWAPAGFARGFLSLADGTEVQYKCTGVYNSKGESGILWNDPEIGIQWPTIIQSALTISEKDKKAQTLGQWLSRPESNNFIFT